MKNTKLSLIVLLITLLGLLATLSIACGHSEAVAISQEVPYEPSNAIEGISWDFDNRVQLAPGSDLWPVTWASDNNLYTSWGDGGGFGGTNNDGRVSLGFARMQGSPPNFTPTNIWGGKNPQNPAQFGGKAVSMLSLNGVLYAWLNQENGDDSDFNLAWSTNLGATWQQADWTFKKSEFGENTFLNFGRDYAGARDNCVYIYGKQGLDFATKIHLARVPKDQITNRNAYEFFTGLTANNTPTWTKSFSNRQAVFEDSNGVGITSVVYNAGLKRYLLTTAHGAFPDGVRKFGMFDATEPWGPWTTVEYNENWGNLSGFWLLYSIPTKTPDWMSSDGKTIHVIFSSGDDLDSFNMVKGTFSLSATSLQNTSQPLIFNNDMGVLSELTLYFPHIQSTDICS